MSPSSVLRRQNAATPLRGFALLLVLCLICSSWPRFQVHAHEARGQAHAHAPGDGHAHDHGHDHALDGAEAAGGRDEVVTGDADPDRLAVHVHDATTVTVALVGVPHIDLPPASLPCWNLAFLSVPAATAAGPPPQRPPIV